MKKDYQTKQGRLNKSKRRGEVLERVIIWTIFLLMISGLLFSIKQVAKTGAEYQCDRLEQQFKQFPEQFFITPIESEMCPELKAPVKEIIN